MERFSFGDVEVDFEEQVAHKNDEEIQFTALEFDILRYFIHRRGRTVSRKQLLRDVWGISGDIPTRTIDRHVASLRKKIEPDPTAPTYIETVYGIGYKFVGDDGG
jgi:DNA-binding response OmpR family regulator